MVDATNFKHPVVDLDEFERRLRGPEPVARTNDDPLAELARLVGGDAQPSQQDALSSMFAQAPRQSVGHGRAAEATNPSVVKLPRAGWDRVEPGMASVQAGNVQHLQESLRGSIQADNSVSDEDPQALFEREMRDMQAKYDPPGMTSSSRHGDEIALPAAKIEPFLHHSPMHAENDDLPTADARASYPGAEADSYETGEHAAGEYDHPELAHPDAPDWNKLPPPRISDRATPNRRPLYKMSAIALVGLVVVGGSLAWRSSTASAGRNVAVIKAQDGPVKIAGASGDGLVVPNQDTSILDKTGNPVKRDVNATTRTVTNSEQPIDLNLAPKAAPIVQPTQPVVNAVAPPEPDPQPENAFGPPKRVKTVAVRPDGSVISNPVASPVFPPSGALPGTNVPAPVARPVATNPVVTTPTAAPATPTATLPVKPKATVRVVPLAKAETKVAAAPVANPADDGNAPLQLAPSAKPPVVKVKVADASPVATIADNAGSGKFAVQLAAPADAQEAKSTSARLQKQYADVLGGRTASIRAGDSSGHTVYRVRVGGMSRDEATALCEKLKSSGGNCFVAKN